MAASLNKKTLAARANIPLRDRHPEPSGSYGVDIIAGKRCAFALLAEIKSSRSEDCCLLGMMILEMARRGYPEKASGVIVGFMGAVASQIPLQPWKTVLREQAGFQTYGEGGNA